MNARRAVPSPGPLRRAMDNLRGLLSPGDRKSGWQLAEQAGIPLPATLNRCSAVLRSF